MGYVELLKAVLVQERGHTTEDAERLVKSHPTIVTQGIFAGNMSLRGCAMALEIMDRDRTPATVRAAQADAGNNLPAPVLAEVAADNQRSRCRETPAHSGEARESTTNQPVGERRKGIARNSRGGQAFYGCHCDSRHDRRCSQGGGFAHPCDCACHHHYESGLSDALDTEWAREREEESCE